MSGWVKLHRSITEFSWWGHPNVIMVYIYLIVRANYQDKMYRGVLVKRGSIACGRIALSGKIGLSVSKFRTAIDKLKSTNHLTMLKYENFSIISITNWESYQSVDSALTEKCTESVPEIATIKEVITKKKNINTSANADIVYCINYLNQKLGTKYLASSTKTKKQLAVLLKVFSTADIISVIDSKHNEWGNNPTMAEYLRPETLFGPKFEGYYNNALVKQNSVNSVSDIDTKLLKLMGVNETN